MKKTSFLLAAAALAAPALAQNDDCSGAIALAPATPTAFDTTAATVGGPAWPCAAGGAPDIWFSYTTTSTDAVTVSTCNNAAYDTAIEIFSGDCSNLVPVTCNDDGPGCTGFTSEAVAAGLPVGTDLYIRVGGWNGSVGTGTVELTLAPPPACSADAFEDNDDCASAVSLSDGSYPGLTLLESDNDYFAVTVADGATLDASITFLNANGDMDLYLWDPLVACDTNVVGQGTQTGPLAVGFSASDDEFITYTNTTGASQNLIIEVDMFDANGCNSYDLSVTGAGVGGPARSAPTTARRPPTPPAPRASISGSASPRSPRTTSRSRRPSLPANQFGIIVTSQTQGFVPNAGGTSNGNLCLGGAIDRFTSAPARSSPRATRRVSSRSPSTWARSPRERRHLRRWRVTPGTSRRGTATRSARARTSPTASRSTSPTDPARFGPRRRRRLRIRALRRATSRGPATHRVAARTDFILLV